VAVPLFGLAGPAFKRPLLYTTTSSRVKSGTSLGRSISVYPSLENVAAELQLGRRGQSIAVEVQGLIGRPSIRRMIAPFAFNSGNVCVVIFALNVRVVDNAGIMPIFTRPI